MLSTLWISFQCIIPPIVFRLKNNFSGVSSVPAAASAQQQQAYRPAYLDHFEKIDQQNKRNMGGNKGPGGMKGDAQNFPGKFLGPIDFEFVSLEK